MNLPSTRSRATAGRALPGATLRRLLRVVTNELVLAASGLAALILLFFYDVVFLGRTLVTSHLLWGVMGTRPGFGYPGRPDYNVYLLDPLASAVASEPVAEKAAALLRQGELPLWDANMALGRPLLASFSPDIMSPVRLPLMLVPTAEMWDAFLLARLLVAGVFTYLLAKRLGLSKPAGFGGAVTFAFSGYFLLYINMPHADYAMMLPVALYALDMLLEKLSPGRLALAAGALAISVLADNPEAAVLLLAYGGAYYCARMLSQGHSRAYLTSALSRLGLAAGLGVGLTAFVVMPFLELTGPLGFGGYALHRHVSGSGIGTAHDPLRAMISLFVPLFDGPPVQNFQHTGWSGVRGWVGLGAAFMALLGLTNWRAMRGGGWFFAVAAVVIVAKTYGVPVVNLVGRLPLLDVIDFGLYSAPLAAFSLAMLAAHGIDRLDRQGWSWRAPAVALVLLAALVLWLVWLNRSLLDTIPKSHLAVYLGAAWGFALAAAAIVAIARSGRVAQSLAPTLVVAIILVELFLPTIPVRGNFGFLTQELFARHIPTLQRPERYDPFREPPYIRYLTSDSSKYRVLGLNYVLYPNTAMVYGIDDVRGFTATTITRYHRYIREFISPSARSRFTGAYLPPLRSEREPPLVADNPMLDLLNVKYVLTNRPLLEAYTSYLTPKILEAHGPSPGVRAELFEINGESDLVLFQHPASSLSYSVTPDKGSSYLVFKLGLDPQVWQPERGDGVRFAVSVRAGGTDNELFSRWVDPKSDAADRRWISGSVDLRAYIGRPITLVLSTDPGESADWDWAGWGGLRLAESAAPPPAGQFRLVYDDEAKVYENANAFPRAFVVHQAQSAGDEDEAIAAMKAEGFDPRETAVIEGELPAEQRSVLAAAPAGAEAKVAVSAYDDNEVKLRVESERPGLLVMSDTYYPGWKAYVDGVETKIYPTDLALRSIFVGPGGHNVEFVYRPASFNIGLLMGGLSLLVLVGYGAASAGLGLVNRKRRGESADNP